MFDFFRRKTAKDYIEASKDNVYTLPKLVEPPPPPPPPEPKEHYRVGFDDIGRTTLTLMADHGSTMTLSMNREACEQLIKMLRATYHDDTPSDPDDDPDGGLPLPVEDERKVA